MLAVAAFGQIFFGAVCLAETAPGAAEPILLAKAIPDPPVLMAIKAPHSFQPPDDYMHLAQAPLMRSRPQARLAGASFALAAGRAGAVGDVLAFYQRSQWRPTVKSGGVAVEWRISFGARQN
jgi:hypothetical protein